MDGASSSQQPDLAGEFKLSVEAARKLKIEDNVFEKTLSTWMKIQELQSIREGGLVATRIQVATENKFKRRLSVSHASDIFSDKGVYFLMLLKEQRVVGRIAFSETFMKTTTGKLATWMASWQYAVEQEIKM